MEENTEQRVDLTLFSPTDGTSLQAYKQDYPLSTSPPRFHTGTHSTQKLFVPTPFPEVNLPKNKRNTTGDKNRKSDGDKPSNEFRYETEVDSLTTDSLVYMPVAMSRRWGKGEVILVSTPCERWEASPSATTNGRYRLHFCRPTFRNW